MNAAAVLKRLERLTIDNSPAILTAVGVVGTVATAYLTGKASFKAANIIRDEQFTRNLNREADENPAELTLKEKVGLVWSDYIPPVTTGTLTVAAIIGSNWISARRAAALVAAYSVSEKAFNEYKEKVLEKFGVNKEQAVRDDVAQDRMGANKVSEQQVFVTGTGEHLCYDHGSGRYFKSSMESMRKAENDINHRIVTRGDGSATLSDFYDLIGLSPTSFSDQVGWDLDDLLHLQFSTTLADDGRPCISVDYELPLKPAFQMHSR